MKILGVLVCITAIFGAMILWLYLLISGIVMAIEGVTASPIDGSMLAWGIVLVIFAEVAGGMFGFFGFMIGTAIFFIGSIERK